MKYPPTPLGAEALRRASANLAAEQVLWQAGASVGHPPVSEIRRSMVDLSLEEFLSGVTHPSSDAIVHGYGRRRPRPRAWSPA